MPDSFPWPWTVTDTEQGSWKVTDANGFPLTWFHYAYRDVVGTNAERMTREQAYAMAVQFARLPVYLGKQPA